MILSVNQRIKEIRVALGLSQAKFASAISISNGYIAGIELENRRVNDRIIKLICSAYNVNETWLKEGTGEMFNQEPDQGLSRALEIFQRLQPDFQEYALEQVEKLLALQEKSKEKE